MRSVQFGIAVVLFMSACLLAAAPASSEIDALIVQLSSSDEKVRRAAQDKLVAMGEDARMALEAHVRSRAAAEAVLQKIDMNKVAGATLLSLDLKNATPENMIAEISKQTGFDIQGSHESVWRQLNAAPITLAVDRQPFWSVMREACSKGGLSVYPGGYADRRIRVMPAAQMGQNTMKCPAVINGAFMVTVNNLQRTSHINMASPQSVNRSMNLSMTTFCEPKVRVIQFSYIPEIDEAVDDKGNSLLSTMRNMGGRQMSSGRGITWSSSIALQYPAELGQKIAKLRGKMRFVIQTRSQTIEITDLLKAKDVTKTAAGWRVTLKEFGKVNEQQYQASIVIHRDGIDQQQFYESVNNPNIRVINADGREFTYNGVNGGNSSGDSFDGKFMFSVRGAGGEALNLGDPATLLWEIPTGVQEITVPFEFADLPFP